MFKSFVSRWDKKKIEKVATFSFAVGLASLSPAAGLRILAAIVATDIVLNIKDEQ